MSSSSIGTGPPVLQEKALSRQAMDDNRATLLEGSGRDVQRPTSHGGKNAHNTVQQPKCPQVLVDGLTLTTSNYYPPLNEYLRFGPYGVGLYVQQEDSDIQSILNLHVQGKLQQPPTTNMDRFKYCIESFHYPIHVCREPTQFQVDIIRKMEWHIRLRHFFVDLDQQLEELEDYLSMSSSSANNDNMDDNTNLTDTAALANWTSYEIPTTKAEEALCFPVTNKTNLDRFTNLRCCQRVVFSQRSVKGDGKQLTGRWLIVAYVFASTYEALDTRKLDVKTLLSPGCSGTVATTDGTGTGTSTHYNTDTMLALRALSWDPQSCIRSGDGPATGRFYQLERRKKMASEFYIYRYGGGDGDQTSGKQRKIGATTTTSTSTPTVAETEDKVDTTITTMTNPKKTDIVEETETSSAEEETEMFPTVYYDPYQRKRRPNQIDVDAAPVGVPIPQELEDRCHLIDRLWPALMTSQYIPPKATTNTTRTATTAGTCTSTQTDSDEWDWIQDWSDTE